MLPVDNIKSSPLAPPLDAEVGTRVLYVISVGSSVCTTTFVVDADGYDAGVVVVVDDDLFSKLLTDCDCTDVTCGIDDAIDPITLLL